MQYRPVDVERSTTRRHGMIALVCVMGMLVICAGRYAVLATLAVRYPYGLDYGEGIVWQQMHMVMTGTAYGPIQGFPSIAFPYPPLYYVISFVVAHVTGWDELATGRLISVLSAVVAAWFAGKIVLRLAGNSLGNKSSTILLSFASLATICTQPIFDFSILMRVDLLFVAFSLAGLYFGIRALDNPSSVLIAATLFVAAIYTKQIAISAPIAVFGILLLVRRRTALVGIAATLALGLAVLIPIMLATRGGFLIHIVYYTITKFDGTRIWDIFIFSATHLIYITIALLSIFLRVRRIYSNGNINNLIDFRNHIAENPRDAAFMMAVLYFIVATVLLVTVLKTGSAVNYFLEWGCLIVLLTAAHFSDLITRLVDSAKSAPTRFQLAALWVMVIQVLALFCLVGQDFRATVAEREDAARLVSIIKRAPKPVSSDDMVALLRAGKPVLWEPFIFAELAQKGAWDQRPLLDKIKAQEFAFFVTEGVAGDGGVYGERYTPAVAQALDAAYPVKSGLGMFVLHFPNDEAMERADTTKAGKPTLGYDDAW